MARQRVESVRGAGRLADTPGIERRVCGGNDTRLSNCLADYVLEALENTSVDLQGVSSASACGIMPDGTWYTN